MKMVKFRLFTFLLILRLTLSASPTEIISRTSVPKKSCNLIEAAVKILKSCYEKQVNVIGIFGDSPSSLIASLSSDQSFAKIILGNSTGSVREGPMKRESRYKLELFAITISSSKELGDILTGIKNSQWWNHMAKFYILDRSTSQSEHGCSRAFEMLWTAWRMDLLEVKFICAHSTRGRLIYTFNPYTSNAPKPWRLDQIHRGENNHPWALLNRVYRGDENYEICENMDFEKTRNLGDYEIRTTISEESFKRYMEISQSDVNDIDGANAIIRRIIFQALRATPKFLVRGREEIVGHGDKEKRPHGVLADTIDGVSDVALTFWNVLTVMNSTSISTRMPLSMVILTRYKGQESQLRKLVTVLDGNTRIGVCLVLFVTLIFLKYFVHQTLGAGILDILRIICNVALTKVPDKLSSRIYLASLFLFMITIQAIYQGRLSSILSKSVALDNVNTVVDLAESDYTIYGLDHLSGLFSDQAFNKERSRFVAIDDFNCTKYVASDPLAACIDDKSYSAHDAGRMKLHVSKESIFDLDFHWAIRDNWPLERRLTMVFMRLAEASLTNHQFDNAMQKDLRAIEANENDDVDQGFHVLALTDLSFAFVILAIGLSCAIISFILEIIIG